jgi:hypothetical protein
VSPSGARVSSAVAWLVLSLHGTSKAKSQQQAASLPTTGLDRTHQRLVSAARPCTIRSSDSVPACTSRSVGDQPSQGLHTTQAAARGGVEPGTLARRESRQVITSCRSIFSQIELSPMPLMFLARRQGGTVKEAKGVLERMFDRDCEVSAILVNGCHHVTSRVANIY